MRDESLPYRAERLEWITQPVIFIRAYYVRAGGSGSEYPFARDFSSDVITEELVDKLVCIKTVAGAAQQADPVAGTSSIGYFEAQLGDDPAGERQVLRQISDPAQPLTAAITTPITQAATVRNSQQIRGFAFRESAVSAITVPDIRGYPDKGHVILDDAEYSYTGIDTATNTFLGVRGGARGTTATTHVLDTIVRNGEQLQRGTRITLFLGYAPLPEAEYGPGPGFIKMEVQSVASQDFNMTWTVRCSDIQRFTKRKIFEGATTTNPANLGPDHPITLMLKVLTSTGQGFNGPYDVLIHEFGAAVPVNLIDVAGWEALRDAPGIAGVTMTFAEVASQDAKTWVESQILRPLAILPYVNQAGQYSGRAIAEAAVATPTTAWWRPGFRMEAP